MFLIDAFILFIVIMIISNIFSNKNKQKNQQKKQHSDPPVVNTMQDLRKHVQSSFDTMMSDWNDEKDVSPRKTTKSFETAEASTPSQADRYNSSESYGSLPPISFPPAGSLGGSLGGALEGIGGGSLGEVLSEGLVSDEGQCVHDDYTHGGDLASQSVASGIGVKVPGGKAGHKTSEKTLDGMKSVHLLESGLTKNDILQGIIMSEILGPPKAKRR